MWALLTFLFCVGAGADGRPDGCDENGCRDRDAPHDERRGARRAAGCTAHACSVQCQAAAAVLWRRHLQWSRDGCLLPRRLSRSGDRKDVRRRASQRYGRFRSCIWYQPPRRIGTRLLRQVPRARGQSTQCEAAMQFMGLLSYAHLLGSRHWLEPHLWRVLYLRTDANRCRSQLRHRKPTVRVPA